MGLESSPDTKLLLDALRSRDPEAIDGVFPLVYAQLRAIARSQRRRASASQTLNTTAVVHEAYIKLLGRGLADLKDRAHFFNLAARVMRQILLDSARKQLTQKRGGDAHVHLLDENRDAGEIAAGSLLDLDDAISRLASLDPRLGEVVYLRFYAGLSVDETAQLIGVTSRTVKRDWRKARAFLHGELHGGEDG